MRIKKLFVALLMMVFVAVLAACGGGDTDTPNFKAKDGTFALNDKGEYVAVVDGEITEMDIKSQFSVTDDYELKLYSDSSFTIEVRGKVQLYVGENTFYLCVIKDGETVEISEPDYYAAIKSVSDKYYKKLLAGDVAFDYDSIYTQKRAEIFAKVETDLLAHYENNVLRPLFETEVKNSQEIANLEVQLREEAVSVLPAAGD